MIGLQVIYTPVMRFEWDPKKNIADLRTDWDRLRKMSDEEAEAAAASDPDAPPTDEEFWDKARLVWSGSKSGSSS